METHELSLLSEIKSLRRELEHIACAYAQVSGNFHRAYYGEWNGYDHPHHPVCCSHSHNQEEVRPSATLSG